MRTIKEKIIAIIMVAAMAVIGIPVMSFAGEVEVGYYSPVYKTSDPKDGLSGMEAKTCTNYSEVTEDTTELHTGWYVVKKRIEKPSMEIKVSGDVHLILADGSMLNIQNIRVKDGNALTIYAQSDAVKQENTGWIICQPPKKYGLDDGNAGIGGGCGEECGHITINGGHIYAKGGQDSHSRETEILGAAGIGSGYSRDGKNIIINGGKIKVEGGDEATGIGAGEHANADGIYINGGVIEAYAGGALSSAIGSASGHGVYKGYAKNIYINDSKVIAFADTNFIQSGAAIGGGRFCNAENIHIRNSFVEAIGGRHSSGIGGGQDGEGKNITITNSTVTAKGRYGAAGIGGGDHGEGLNITIDNSNVEARGDHDGAGIGGGEDRKGRNIIIKNHSEVEAYGSQVDGGAGIGGGQDGTGEKLEIYDSTVKVWGGDDSAGIGGGEGRGACNIIIENSTVTAYGDENGAGIGGGESGEAIDITIKDSNVKAYGGYDGAGIGGGDSGKAKNIKIIGGNVEAYGGNGGGAGIGGGYKRNADGISFENCDVKAVGMGRADAVGSAKSSGRSSNIKVQQGLYLNKVKVEDGNKDRAGELYNVHNVHIAKNAETSEETSEHKGTFKAEGPVITATCSNVDHKAFSPDQIILEKPENTAFNGNGKKVRVNGFIDSVDIPDVKYYNGDNELTEAPKNVGTYIARLTLGEGEGAATAELEFNINPAAKAIKSVKAGNKKLTAKWKKSSKAYREQISGYEILVSESKSFEESKTKTVYAKAGATSKTIKKLKAGKKYYIKMRAYKTVDEQNYWSAWSKVKVKKTR